MISILFLCTIFLFFDYSFCSENVKKTSFNQKLLQPFFPITGAYQRVIPVFSYTKNNNLPVPFNDKQAEFLANQKETELLAECLLSKNTVKLLNACQNKTYGFCYAGMICNGDNPKLALVNHQYPYYLNLELYYFRSNMPKNENLIVRSENIDPTFYPGLTRKIKIHNNTPSFWQTSCYHTQTEEGFDESYSSFWGPFFDKHNGAGCFFYTDIPSHWNTINTCLPSSTKEYPAYAIFYHYINRAGVQYSQPCYVSYKPSQYNTPLYANIDHYFSLVLATFFPCKNINGKKIFFTYTYTAKELNSLKIYLNRIRNSPVPVPRKIEKYIQNSALFVLLLHFLNHTKGSIAHQEFYTEINSKIDVLKQICMATSHTQNKYYSASKKRSFNDQ